MDPPPPHDDAPTHGQLAGFAPRKSSYLRISPTLVLQLILYLEPHHVEWMNVGVFERMLVALRERIPRKLEQEDITGRKGGGGGKQKDKVDVFRGTDYQMAFFFRRTNDKHVVLLKEKHLHYVTKSVPRQPTTSTSNPRLRTRSPSNFVNDAPPPPPHPHTKSSSLSHDPSHQPGPEAEEEDALGMMGPPPAKRSRKNSSTTLPRGSDDSATPLTRSEETDPSHASAEVGSEARRREENEGEEGNEMMAIKPEPIELDPLVALSEGVPQANPLFREESQTPAPGDEGELEGEGEGEEEMNEELDEDVKPQLKVNYQKFEIFNRSLVVIVEPYPPLPASALQSSKLMASTRTTSEIRQLSASVQPQTQPRRSESVYSRAGTLSVTPAPTGSSRRGGALFRRSETTPLTDNDDDDDDRGARGGEEDDQMRGLREMSEVFRRREGGESDDSDEDLPSVDQALEKVRRKKMLQRERESQTPAEQ
ncbi:uncharacterized protein JCM6883_005121 [Sporobolomyces salmoneus]|uniref:uncharacterized protein n=1 Tax=Sporobolomyces salmoneus TaxID=183962 RepID=UPI00316E3319